MVESESPGNVLLTSRDGAAHIEILSDSVFPDWSLGEFTDHYRQRVGRQAASWQDYRELSAAGAFRGATNYVRIEFLRQKGSGDCVESGTTEVYRSRFFPTVQRGYAVTLSICQGSLESYATLLDVILESFSEFQVE